jgi:hypothetical protein
MEVLLITFSCVSAALGRCRGLALRSLHASSSGCVVWWPLANGHGLVLAAISNDGLLASG